MSVDRLASAPVNRLGRALHVGLDDHRQFLGRAFADALHHLLERTASTSGARQLVLAVATGTEVRDLARARFALDDVEFVAGLRRAVEAQYLDRESRQRLLHRVAAIVHQTAHAAPYGAGHQHVADLQRATLHQHGGHRAAARIELGFDDDAVGHAVRVGLELEHLGLHEDGFLELVEIGLLGRRDLDRLHFAAQRFDLDLVLQQLGADAVGVGTGFVDLVDGDDDRHARGLGVGDRLHGLGHDAVIGGHHQHDDVRHLGAAHAHRREGFVARRVEEGDLLAGGQGRPDRRRYAG